MASIGTLINHVDSILKEIQEMEQDVYTEESLHNSEVGLIKQDMEDRVSSEKERAEAEISMIEKQYQDRVAALQRQLTVALQNEKNLESYHSRSEIDYNSLVINREELKTIPTDGLIRELTSIDLRRAFSKRKSLRIVGELYTRFDQEIEWAKAEIIRLEAEKQHMLQEKYNGWHIINETIQREYQQRMDAEEHRYNSVLGELNERKNQQNIYLQNHSLKAECEKTVKESGGSEFVLKNYQEPAEMPAETLLGRILYPINVENPTENEMELIRHIPNFMENPMGVVLPYAVAADHSELICYESASGTHEAAEVFRQYVLRQLNSFPKGTFQAVFYDPIKRGESLGFFSSLTKEQNGCGACEMYLSGKDLNVRLNEIVTHIDEINRKLNVSGCQTINEYNKNRQEDRIPYISLVLIDYPAGLDSSSLTLLRIIMEQTDRCGISVLIAFESKTNEQAFSLIDRNQEEIIYITSRGGRCMVKAPGLKNEVAYVPMKIDVEPKYLKAFNDAGQITDIIDEQPEQEINNLFSHFFSNDQMPEVFPRDSTKGLMIPFAVSRDWKPGDMPMEYSIGFDKSAHGFICGGTGAGKTVLINTLITSAILCYPPEELQLWLVDYKVDEFAFYTRHWPKQVRYVITDKSDDITYSVIDEIEREMERRQKIFSDPNISVAEYKDYRGKMKENGDLHMTVMPRILVIVDEFHRMSQIIDDDLEYKEKLTNILREARSLGISLLFSDQGIGGLRGLSDAAKAQISARIAMRHNSESEIAETLMSSGINKTDEATRGEIRRLTAGKEGAFIYRKEDQSENKSSFANEVRYISGRGLYLPKDDNIRKVYINLANRANASAEYDHDFFTGRIRKERNPKEIERYEKINPAWDSSLDRFFIGTPLGVQKAFCIDLKNQKDEDLLVVGKNEEVQYSLAKSMIQSALDQGYRLVVMVPKNARIYTRNQSFFESIPDINLLTSFPDMCNYIRIKADEAEKHMSAEDFMDFDTDENGRKTLVIWLGTDAILNMMKKSRNKKEEAMASYGESISGSDGTEKVKLKDAAEDKPKVDPTTIDPANNKQIMELINGEIDLLDRKSAEQDRQSARDEIHSDSSKNNANQHKGYNATDDVKRLIINGYELNLHIMMVVERFDSLKELRLVTSGSTYFAHRIAMQMSPDEASSFMSGTNRIKQYMGSDSREVIFYSYNMGRIIPFLPYLTPEYE